jgi:hypothetical protein
VGEVGAKAIVDATREVRMKYVVFESDWAGATVLCC